MIGTTLEQEIDYYYIINNSVISSQACISENITIVIYNNLNKTHKLYIESLIPKLLPRYQREAQQLLNGYEIYLGEIEKRPRFHIPTQYQSSEGEYLIAHHISQKAKINLIPLTSLNKCLASEEKFIVIPITIVNIYVRDVIYNENTQKLEIIPSSSSKHSNLILINKELREIEHFEPRGGILSAFRDNPNIELTLIEFLNSMGVPSDYRYFSAMQWCPYGPQLYEITSSRLWFGFKGGFCAYWSLYYFAARIQNPDATRNEVIDMLLNLSSNDLADLIIRFSNDLATATKSSVKK